MRNPNGIGSTEFGSAFSWETSNSIEAPRVIILLEPTSLGPLTILKVRLARTHAPQCMRVLPSAPSSSLPPVIDVALRGYCRYQTENMQLVILQFPAHVKVPGEDRPKWHA